MVYWFARSQPSLERKLDLPVVIQRIQQLSELVSVKYTVQKVVGLEEQKAPFGAEKLLLTVQAEVLAGVDLSKLTTADVRPSSAQGNGDQRLIVSLPPPEILHVLVDEENTQVWDRQITWWTPWVPFNRDLERQARLAAVDSVRDSALEMGILDDAERNAEQSIRGLLEALGAGAVTFE